MWHFSFTESSEIVHTTTYTGKNTLNINTLKFINKTSDLISGGSRIFPGEGGRGAPTPKVGAWTYFFGRKLHKNERILAPGGGVPGAPP